MFVVPLKETLETDQIPAYGVAELAVVPAAAMENKNTGPTLRA